MVRPNVVVAGVILCWGAQAGAAQEREAEALLRVAVLPLPTSMQADAGVLLESPSGDIRWARESSNGFSCILRDHSRRAPDLFDARCYSDEFWPAILRWWEVIPQYESRAELTEHMHRELEEGLIALPESPTAGYRIRGSMSDVDFESGTLGSDVVKWQSVHFPFRTSSELGLTEEREPSLDGQPGGMPFVMASGTWWSHVMIVHQDLSR